MKVSVITVCYNSDATIRDTIESVLSQTYHDIQYIIVDGGSTDGTMAIINDYKDKISNIISEKDKGIYDAMNKGVVQATGDVIGILNSDDFFADETIIQMVVDTFLSTPKLDLVYGDVVFVDPQNLAKPTRYYRASHFKPWKLRFGWMPPHPATFIKSQCYERVGRYSLDYSIASDYELFVRMLLVGHATSQWLGRNCVVMREGGISTQGFKSRLLLNQEIVRACKSNGIYTNLFLVLTKVPFKLIEWVRLPNGAKT